MIELNPKYDFGKGKLDTCMLLEDRILIQLGLLSPATIELNLIYAISKSLKVAAN